MRLQTGQLLAGRYRVERLLGTGGVAEVYQVWDNRRAAYLALKLLRSELGPIPDLLSRFQNEALALSHLQHPNIVRFYEFTQEGSLVFFLMDFIDGKSLRQDLQQSRTPYNLNQLLSILRPVCTALQYAHNLGIIHCDVKPENILVNQAGHVLLNDFGIALMAGTYAGIAGGVGTPAYMAPEQIRDERVTPQTDLYALGIVIYEMLTGVKPFNGRQAPFNASLGERVRWEQINHLPSRPSMVNPHLSSRVDALLLRCLEKEPLRRCPNALEILQVFENLDPESDFNRAQTDPPNALPLLQEKSSLPSIKNRTRKVIPIGGGLVLILLIVLFSFIGKPFEKAKLSTLTVNSPMTYAYPMSCMDIVVRLQPKTDLYECITSITVHADGTLQVNMEWKVTSLSTSSGVVVHPDTDNHQMYLLDDLGNRLDHITTGGGTNQKVELFNGQSKLGWFLFPAVDPTAASFYFVDDDNNVKSPRLDRQWP